MQMAELEQLRDSSQGRYGPKAELASSTTSSFLVDFNQMISSAHADAAGCPASTLLTAMVGRRQLDASGARLLTIGLCRAHDKWRKTSALRICRMSRQGTLNACAMLLGCYLCRPCLNLLLIF
jgi:hypothetical protein